MKNKKWILGVSIIILLLYIGLIVIAGFCCKEYENVYYVSQISSAFFVIAGVVIAMWQYIISSNEQINAQKRELDIREREIIEIEKDRIQKAIDLANYYKDNIIYNTGIIEAVYKEVGIKDILDMIDFNKMVEFDQHELNELIPKDKQDKIRKAVCSSKFLEILSKNSIIYDFGNNAKITTTFKDEIKGVQKSVTIDQVVLLREYGVIISKVLNNLEYFSMNFTHQIADQSVVYQSLHCSYLRLMRILYYDIAQNNKVGEEKLYTNAIELFNIWREKAEQQRKDGIALQRGTVEKGTELPKKYK